MVEQFAIGIDLGGTKIEGAVVNGNGELLQRLRIPTNKAQGADAIVGSIAGLIDDLLKKSEKISVSAIGVGVAGQVEKDTGKVIYAPNLQWQNVDLKGPLMTRFDMPVRVCNDVRAAAWGEWLSGAGKGCDNLVSIFVGTGVGGAIICNGQMVDGHNNTAGEIGHIVAQMAGPLCTCGNRGCLEAIAGGWAIRREAQQKVQNDPEGGKMLLDMTGGRIESITAETVINAALKHDVLANKIIDSVADALIASIVSIVNTIGPEKIILGGGIIEGMPQLVGRIEERVKLNALGAAIANVDITQAQLHGDAGAIGAGLFALRSL